FGLVTPAPGDIEAKYTVESRKLVVRISSLHLAIAQECSVSYIDAGIGCLKGGLPHACVALQSANDSQKGSKRRMEAKSRQRLQWGKVLRNCVVNCPTKS